MGNIKIMTTHIARQSDIDALVKLLGVLFSQEVEFEPNIDRQQQALREIIRSPQLGEILVLKDGQRIIGMVSLLYTISTALGGAVALLEDMVIDPDYRNRGAGTKLLNDAVQRASLRGCQRVTLLTDGDNIKAQRFYQRHGFTVSSMKPFRAHL